MHMYTPDGADDWKTTVKAACVKAWDGRQLLGPVKVDIQVYFERPKKHYTKKGLRDNAPTWHCSKPDRDNCDKAILDALTDLGVMKDDSQACAGGVTKQYATAETGAQITITEL